MNVPKGAPIQEPTRSARRYRPAEGELLQRPTEVLRRGAPVPKPPMTEVQPIERPPAPEPWPTSADWRPWASLQVPDPRLVVEEKGLDMGLVALVIGCGAFVLALLAIGGVRP